MREIKFSTVRRRNQLISFLIFLNLVILLALSLIPNPWYNIPLNWYFIPVLGVVGSFITPLFLGRHYCGQYCPTSFIADGINPNNTAGKFLKSRILRIPLLIIFFGIFLVSFSSWNMGLPAEMTETYWQAVMSKLWVLWLVCPFVIALPFIVLIGLLKGGRTWCNYICPWGTIGVALGKPQLEVTDKCTGCRNCIKECPQPEIREDIIGNGGLVDKNCLTCLKCVDVCPQDAHRLK